MRTVNYLATEAIMAAGINLDSLKNLVIKVLGTVLIIILLARIMNAYAKRQWGEIVAEVIGVIVVGFFMWTPDTAISLLQSISNSISPSAMTLPLPTDTAHVRIESRQYRIFNFDLGEGIRRSSMKVATLIFTPWLIMMGVLGVSLLEMPYLWFGPPAIATWLAVSRDDSGRVRLRSWLDAAAYRLNRSDRLILNGDTARPDTPPPGLHPRGPLGPRPHAIRRSGSAVRA